MTIVLDDVRQEIVEFHAFFVAWFNGSVDAGSLGEQLVARLDPGMKLISPDGAATSVDQLIDGFRQSFGCNRDFRIQIRDVAICHDLGAHVLATYTEWQTGSRKSASARNARQSSILMTRRHPFRWLHVHETWLPEAVRAADPFDF